MANCVLVKLPNARLYKDKNLTLLEPLGLQYIAAFANNHNIKIVDLDIVGKSELFKTIDIINPEFIGITVSTPMVKECKELIVEIRAKYPNIKFIVGGGHPSALPLQSLRDTNADYAVRGEGELTFKEILDGAELKNINGLAFEDTINLPRPYIKNLDSLPLPLRYMDNRSSYRVSFDFDGIESQKCASIITSRSCPFNCIYCASKSIFGSKVRFRSISNIISEIEYLVNDLGINTILFVDDCFTLIKSRVENFCNEVIRKNLKFVWWIDTRVDYISEELLRLMKKAGCQFIVFGIESGSQRVIDRIGKKITIDSVIRAFRAAHNVGIYTKANFMLGHLDETEEDIFETINLAKLLKATRYGFYLVLPLPGSELYNIAIKRGCNIGDFGEFLWYGKPVSNISKVSHERLQELQKFAYNENKFIK